MPCRDESVTLLELLIAIALLSVLILGINSINVFSRYHLISSDRRAKVQNDVSYCLGHITKQGLRTIGNESIFGVNSAVVAVTNTSLAFFVDANSDGRRDTGNDYWIKYTLNPSNNQLLYCGNCGNSSACASCATEVLSDRITAFNPTKAASFTQGNHVEVQLSGRWNPAASASTDNPEITMRSTISLPSLSTH